MEDMETSEENTHLLIESNDQLSGETPKMDIDEALLTSSAFNGRFQIILQLVMMYLSVTVSYQIVFSYFIGDNPPWKCTSNNTHNVSDDFCRMNHGREIPINSDKFYQRCNLTRDQWTYITPSSYSYVTEFDLVCNREYLAALLKGAVFIGGMAQLFTGILMDTYGRRIILLFCLIINIVVSIGCTFATQVWQLICLRIVLGGALFTVYAGAFLLLLEFMTPKSRAMSTSIYLLSFNVSLFLVDGAAYFIRDWRPLNLYVLPPAVISLLLCFAIPESPRWLLANNKTMEAERVMKQIADVNSRPFAPIALKSHVITSDRKYTYMDLLRNWKVVFMTLSLGLIYATMALVYYEIALQSARIGGNIYKIFALSTVADIPSYFVALYMCNYFGRKKTVLASLLLSGIMTGSIALIPESYTAVYTVKISLAMISKVFVNIGFMGLYVWSFELFPTVIRSQGCSVCACIEKIGALAVPLLTSALKDMSYNLPYIVVGVTAICCSFIGLFLTETNNKPTRESYEDLISDDTLDTK